MFEDFSKGTQYRKYQASRLPILLFSAVLVALILWGGQMMINELSSKQKKTQQEILRREDALLKKIQVKILETGYEKSRPGIQAAYFPMLVVEVTNISWETLTKIRLASYLKKNGGVICGGACDIDVLRSGEVEVVALTCSPPSGVKSSLRGFQLTQPEESFSFELGLEAAGISLVVENGKIASKLISSRFPD
jgi:hypothetical protein